MMLRFLLVLLTLAWAVNPRIVGAQATSGAALEEATRKVASELRCPVCQGTSIEDSPTDLARQMRAVVRDQLAQGRTPVEVRAYFVSRYGEWILLQPKPSGFNLLVYLLPILGLIAGGVVIVLSVRRWTREPPGPRAVAPGSAPTSTTRAPE